MTNHRSNTQSVRSRVRLTRVSADNFRFVFTVLRLFRMYTTALALGVGVLIWAYQKLRPPPPKICGSPNGPPITSPRVKLSDGRHLAYRELGVPKEKANYIVILYHGYASSKDLYLPLSQDFMESLGIYIVAFDRPGYGESDPNPKKTIKTETHDLQEFADKLQLGSKFYVVGLSLGNYITWGCLNYIPHRLAGAALVVPVVNYWWPSIPSELFNEAFGLLPKSGQRSLWLAHNAPWLLHWWLTQKWFPSVIVPVTTFAPCDVEILKKMSQIANPHEHKMTQQGEYESLHKDLMIGFAKWEFDPMQMKNPFADEEDGHGKVQLWQGYEDSFVPYQLQRFLAKKLPWIKYHEVPKGMGGHFIIHDPDLCESIFRSLLLGEEPSFN